MTIPESIELREIKKRLAKNHATRADVDRARAILAGNASALARFNALAAEKFAAKTAADTTAADRKRRQREREAAFDILDVADPSRRESCRLDLVRFGVTYCGNLLKHAPSDVIVRSLILPLQNAILSGGLYEVEFPRGTGKTTWFKIAMIWAVLYGHKRFVVTIAATRSHAEAINDQILSTLESSPALREDFPAICAPIVALAGNWRKASTQKFEGVPTRMEFSDGYLVLPTVFKTGTETPVEPAAGSVFYTAGIHGAIRGLSRNSLRPDLLLFDDPQTREEAESATSSDKLERLIEGDALGNFGHGDIRTAIMAITPIRPGDIASRFSDRALHAAWGASKQAYIIKPSDAFEELFPAFRECYADDVAAQKAANLAGEPLPMDKAWASSTQFYLDHRADFAGTEVVDPLNFNSLEIDGIHHILNVRASYRDQSLFQAELQMDVSGEIDGTAIEPDEVISRTNSIPRDVLPPGTFDAVAFIDVNTSKGAGLRWCVTAFGPNRVAAVIDYGRFPKDGSALVPPNTPSPQKKDLIKRGIRSVVREIVNLPIRHPNGSRVFPVALGIDAGFATDAVHEVAAEIANGVRLHGMDIYCTHGRSWSQFKNFKQKEERDIVSKDHVYSGVVLKRVNGRVHARKYLGLHSDYWREIAQKGFLNNPLEEGSVSLFGAEPSLHRDFANEICYEQLVRIYREDKRPFRQAWDWVNSNPGHNHYLDCLYGTFAVACWKDVYRARVSGNLVNPRFVKPAAPVKAEWLDKSDALAVERVRAGRGTRPACPSAPRRFFKRFKKA